MYQQRDTREFDRNFKGNISIEKIMIRVVDTPVAMYRRPLSVNHFDGKQQSAVADTVLSTMHRSGALGTLTRQSFSGVAGGFMRPTEAPTTVINDCRSTYAVVWMWVRYGSGNFNATYELIYARMPAEALCFDNFGNVVDIEDSAQLTINNVVKLNVRHESVRGGLRETFDYSHACEFVADPNYKSYQSADRLLIQSPTTALYQSISNRATSNIANNHGGNDLTATPTAAMITGTPKVVAKASVIPAAFIATAANAYIAGNYSSDDTGVRQDNFDPDQVDNAMQASRMSDAANKANWSPFQAGFKFQHAISSISNAVNVGTDTGLYGGVFYWGDVVTIDPVYGNITSNEADRLITIVIPKHLMYHNSIVANMRHDDRSEWSETSPEASACMMLINMTLALMFELGVSTVTFNGTNQNHEGMIRCWMREGGDLNLISDSDRILVTNQFLTRMENEILPEVASSGDGDYYDFYAAVQADALGDVTVSFSMNGGPQVTKTISATYSNQYSTLITPFSSTLASVSSMLGSVMDTVAERAQRDSLRIYTDRQNDKPITSPSWAR